MDSCSFRKTVVIKLGGSVLVGANSYGQASRFIVRRLHRCAEERFLVVVSAQNGLTDELERLARGIAVCPNTRSLDLLWSTGEMRSVARLTLHLEEMGVRAVGLNAHETGLRFNASGQADAGIESLPGELRRAFHLPLDCVWLFGAWMTPHLPSSFPAMSVQQNSRLMAKSVRKSDSAIDSQCQFPSTCHSSESTFANDRNHHS